MDIIDLLSDALLAYGSSQFGGAIPKLAYSFERELIDYPDAAPSSIWVVRVTLRGIAALDATTGEAQVSHLKEFQGQGDTREEALDQIHKEVGAFLEGEKFFHIAKIDGIDHALTLLAKDRQPIENIWPAPDAPDASSDVKSSPDQANGAMPTA